MDRPPRDPVLDDKEEELDVVSPSPAEEEVSVAEAMDYPSPELSTTVLQSATEVGALDANTIIGGTEQEPEDVVAGHPEVSLKAENISVHAVRFFLDFSQSCM